MKPKKGILMKRKISNDQLTPGTVVLIRGQIGLSKISSQTTDEEREEINKHIYPRKANKNCTIISIYNARVLAKDPKNLTPEEIYCVKGFYKSKNPGEYPGSNYTDMNKSQFLPKIGILEEGSDINNPSYKEIKLEGEPEKGTNVTIAIRIFKSHDKNLTALDTVLINQPDFQYVKE